MLSCSFALSERNRSIVYAKLSSWVYLLQPDTRKDVTSTCSGYFRGSTVSPSNPLATNTAAQSGLCCLPPGASSIPAKFCFRSFYERQASFVSAERYEQIIKQVLSPAELDEQIVRQVFSLQNFMNRSSGKLCLTNRLSSKVYLYRTVRTDGHEDFSPQNFTNRLLNKVVFFAHFSIFQSLVLQFLLFRAWCAKTRYGQTFTDLCHRRKKSSEMRNEREPKPALTCCTLQTDCQAHECCFRRTNPHFGQAKFVLRTDGQASFVSAELYEVIVKQGLSSQNFPNRSSSNHCLHRTL